MFVKENNKYLHSDFTVDLSLKKNFCVKIINEIFA